MFCHLTATLPGAVLVILSILVAPSFQQSLAVQACCDVLIPSPGTSGNVVKQVFSSPCPT